MRVHDEAERRALSLDRPGDGEERTPICRMLQDQAGSGERSPCVHGQAWETMSDERNRRTRLDVFLIRVRLRDRGDVSLGEPVMAEGGSVEKVKHAYGCLIYLGCTCGAGRK